MYVCLRGKLNPETFPSFVESFFSNPPLHEMLFHGITENLAHFFVLFFLKKAVIPNVENSAVEKWPDFPCLLCGNAAAQTFQVVSISNLYMQLLALTSNSN